jgi:hypothetical protein
MKKRRRRRKAKTDYLKGLVSEFVKISDLLS